MMKRYLLLLSFTGAFLLIVLTADRPAGRHLPLAPRVTGGARPGALEALEAWTRERAYPFADILPGRFARAFAFTGGAMKGRWTSTAGGWVSMGPNNLAGRMISIICNPLNGNTVYAGSASGGLWRSHTGGLGSDWHRIATGYPVLGVGAIAIDPGDTNILYIGTGEVYRYAGAAGGLVIRTTRGSYGIGILKSTDGGMSWSKSLDWSYSDQQGVQAIKLNPLNPATVWAATSAGMFKSTDAGATWSNVLAVHMGEDILIHPTDTNRVLVSMGNFQDFDGIFLTTDGGANWAAVSPASFSGKTLLAINAQNPSTVFADIADSTTGAGSLWRSTDFGLTWSPIPTSSIYGVQGWYSHYIAVHPADSNRLFHSAVSSAYSTNGGVSWSSPGGGPYSDNHAYAIDPSNPDILYTANDDGIERSTNFGMSWADVDLNLQTGQFYSGFANSSTDSNLAIVQSQDHIPGYLYSGSATWSRSVVDEAGATVIDPVNDNLMYALSRFGNAFYRSTNRGASFGFVTGLSTTGAWNSPLVISPSSTNVLYAGKVKIFKSTNSGTSFSAMNGNVALDSNTILALAVSATNPDTVYAGTAPTVHAAHIFRSTNGGANWTNITGPLPNRYVLDLAVDPADSRIVYAGLGGYGTGHLFRTTTAGGSWSDVSTGLPDIPVTAVLVDPMNSNVLYAGTDLTVHVSTDAGSTWYPFSDGLPDAVLVSDLTMTPSNRTIRVSTHGNGAYERKMPGLFPSLSLQQPNGGEVWPAATPQTIVWSHAIVPAVKLEFSTDDGATWLTIADSVGGYANQYAWLAPTTLTTAGRVRVTSLADTALQDASASAFTVYFDGNVVSYGGGWEMVSVPVEAPDTRATALFPSALSGAFAYAGTYVLAETLRPGTGYWLSLPPAETVLLGGIPITQDTVDVVDGWNLIGGIGSPVAVASLTSDPGGLVTSQFFGFEGVYTSDDTLAPGSGYWVKVSGSGTLMLSAAPAADPAARIRIRPTTESPPAPPRGDVAADAGQVPQSCALYQNYPNPFNPRTRIRFRTLEAGPVALKVFDALGREVATLVQGFLPAGEHEAAWDAAAAPSGVYFCRLTAAAFTESRKLMLIR